MKTGFGHFLEFGTSDGLDIAYLDSTRCFLTFGHGMRSCMINYACIISIICAKKCQEMRLWAFHSCLGLRKDVILWP